ncbi:MAG: hypothetical protein AAF513_02405, partial [Pseudomonadota bacterium]
MGTRLENRVLVTPDVGVPYTFADSLVVRGPVRAGDLLIVDPSAEAGEGEIARRDPVNGLADVLTNGELMSEPWAITVDDAGRLLIADRQADPLGSGTQRGALLRYDPVTDEMTTVTSSSLFVDPVDVMLVGNEVLLLDDD